MPLEIADHTLFVNWSRMPQQQHGAQQPPMAPADAGTLAVLKKRQRLALEQCCAKRR